MKKEKKHIFCSIYFELLAKKMIHGLFLTKHKKELLGICHGSGEGSNNRVSFTEALLADSSNKSEKHMVW